VIQDLTGKCKTFEDQLASLNSFYSERRSYQNKIKDLEVVIEELNKKLGSSTAMTKEREASIAVINKRLTGKDTRINKLALIL
jgi:peptidoglycan hydrolase CwlO-like protein